MLNHIARAHALEIDSEINGLIKKQVIRECNHVHGEFLSPIFSVPKKDGKVRLILNLKNLNQHIPYEHFKMDSIFSALELVTQECWMASLDLKDAYYSVKIHPAYQKYLRFYYNNKIYEYTAYRSGLSSRPRKFTKLLKPVLCGCNPLAKNSK